MLVKNKTKQNKTPPPDQISNSDHYFQEKHISAELFISLLVPFLFSQDKGAFSAIL